jgi:Integrase core domain
VVGAEPPHEQEGLGPTAIAPLDQPFVGLFGLLDPPSLVLPDGAQVVGVGCATVAPVGRMPSAQFEIADFPGVQTGAHAGVICTVHRHRFTRAGSYGSDGQGRRVAHNPTASTCSRYLVAGISARRTAAAALIFLDQVLEELPFPIQRLQTDRGTEFFAEEVQRRLISPIPLRSPHLNGKVERVQRTILEEFWATVNSKGSDIADRLAEWVHHYNPASSHPSRYAFEGKETLLLECLSRGVFSVLSRPLDDGLRLHAVEDGAVE